MNAQLRYCLLLAFCWGICFISSRAAAQHHAAKEPCKINCLDDVTLTTQAEVDAFDCTSVQNLTINARQDCADPITNLKALCSLVTIEEDLTIEGDSQLTSLEGLHKLTRISGTFTLSAAGVRNFEGLGALTSVGTLAIEDAGLTSFRGLDKLRSVGSIRVENSELVSFEGIGPATVDNDLSVTNSDAFVDPSALANIQRIGGDLILTGNTNLSDCCVLPALQDKVDGTIVLENNAENCSSREAVAENCDEPVAEIDCSQEEIVLTTQAEVDAFDCTSTNNLTINFDNQADPITNLDQLSSLTEVSGNLALDFLFDNSEGIDLSGLNNLKRVEGNLSFDGTEPSFDGLQGLEFVGGRLIFSRLGSESIENFTALSNLRYVEERIVLSSSNVSGFRGLSQLTSVGGFFLDESSITNFEGLTSLVLIRGNVFTEQEDSDIGSFKGLERVERITGDLSVLFQSIDFQGLNNLRFIDGDFLVQESFVDLGGLQSLQAVGGNLFLGGVDGPAIRNLQALSNLQTVGGSFIIESTFAEDLSTLASLQSVTGDLTVRNNPNLSDCCIIPSLTDIVEGTIIVRNNAPECSSLEAIEENCEEETASEENARLSDGILAYPNPSVNYLKVRTDKPTTVQLYNTTGYLVQQQHIEGEGTLDVSKVAAGVYLLKAAGEPVRRIVIE